jgi:hypothetical protein
VKHIITITAILALASMAYTHSHHDADNDIAITPAACGSSDIRSLAHQIDWECRP